jgi:hypothetical protein
MVVCLVKKKQVLILSENKDGWRSFDYAQGFGLIRADFLCLVYINNDNSGGKYKKKSEKSY